MHHKSILSHLRFKSEISLQNVSSYKICSDFWSTRILWGVSMRLIIGIGDPSSHGLKVYIIFTLICGSFSFSLYPTRDSIYHIFVGPLRSTSSLCSNHPNVFLTIFFNRSQPSPFYECILIIFDYFFCNCTLKNLQYITRVHICVTFFTT